MTGVPLRFGPLACGDHAVYRSGMRWLIEPGGHCTAGRAIAYCSVTFKPAARGNASAPFADEPILQIVCAPTVSGRVTFDPAAAPGGYLSVLGFNAWDADEVLAQIEPDDDAGAANAEVRLMFLAGRRMTPLVDLRPGLFPGWHSRSRAWWGDASPQTLLALGVCDVSGVVLGEDGAFLEMFGADRAATQVVFVPDHPLAPSAPILLDQLERTPAQARAIVDDLHAALARATPSPTADDWIFAGAFAAAIGRSPIRDTYEIVGRSGLTRTGPADAVLLSLTIESPSILRHRTLGYRVQILTHYQSAMGPAIRAWLAKSFEPVQRTTETIRADYQALIETIERTTGAAVFVVNRMSTAGDEDIAQYGAFDAPLSATLATVAAKEQNLMLHDLAETCEVTIIDVDALAAEFGGRDHLPDGVHQSKLMQGLLREEIVRAMAALRVRV